MGQLSSFPPPSARVNEYPLASGLSPFAQQASENLQEALLQITEEYTISTEIFSSDDLGELLRNQITLFESQVVADTQLSPEEKQAMVIVAAGQRESIADLVESAALMFESTEESAGGRATGINWKRIGNIVGSIIVITVAVSLAAGVIVGLAANYGLIAGSAWVASNVAGFITGGMVVGAVAGFLTGAALAASNQCIIQIGKGLGPCTV